MQIEGKQKPFDLRCKWMLMFRLLQNSNPNIIKPFVSFLVRMKKITFKSLLNRQFSDKRFQTINHDQKLSCHLFT